MTTALEWGEGSASRPGRSLPPGKTRYPLYRRLGGPQGRSGQVRKISPPTGIRSPDRPVRSQSLYRLSYRAHRTWYGVCNVFELLDCGSSNVVIHVHEVACTIVFNSNILTAITINTVVFLVDISLIDCLQCAWCSAETEV